jgi:hypothetical protein
LASSTVARRQRVDRELGDGFVRPRIWLVVEDVHCAVPDLEKIDVAGDRGLGVSGEKPDAAFLFERCDVVLGEPHRDFDGDRRRIVREHEAPKLGVALIVAANSGQYEGGQLGRRVLFFDDNELVEREKIRRKLRAPATVLALEQIVRAGLRNRFEKVGER